VPGIDGNPLVERASRQERDSNIYIYIKRERKRDTLRERKKGGKERKMKKT